MAARRPARRPGLTDWLKDVAPSSELRRWFAHDPQKWDEFRRRYFDELDRHPEAWRPLWDAVVAGDITLLYSARDTEHNNAVALREYLTRRRPTDPREHRPARTAVTTEG